MEGSILSEVILKKLEGTKRNSTKRILKIQQLYIMQLDTTICPLLSSWSKTVQVSFLFLLVW